MIRVKEGDRLTQGALVAEGRGLFARSIKAPRAGRVMISGGGQVLRGWNYAPACRAW
jgi:hypothetical protein